MAKATGIGPEHVAAAAVAAAVVYLFYTATKAAGPVPSPDRPGDLTEIEAPVQNFASHLAQPSELVFEVVRVPHRYPEQTCPGVTRTMHQGFAPQYKVGDPQVMAAPSEAAW